ncbi:MAG: anti-sigma factor family protein [Planctomycetota bacterium]|jgi:hypothetical protein
MENNCQKYKERIEQYITGDLPEQDSYELIQHLDQCPDCSDYMQALQCDHELLCDFAESLKPKLKQIENNITKAISDRTSNRQTGFSLVWHKIKGRRFGNIAAAAVILIVAGYAVGRITGPRPVDEQNLRASIESSVRQDLLEQFKREWQSAFVNGYLQLKDDLNRQFHSELDAYAVQTLKASNAVTNQLLTELIGSINASQKQDRRWIAEVLEQIELNRLRDNSQLRNDFASFADLTENRLIQTKQDLLKLTNYKEPKNINHSNEKE